MLGDSVVADAFLSLIALLLPPTSPGDTSLDGTAADHGALERECWGKRLEWRAFGTTQSALHDFHLDTLPLGLCNYATRCDGALQVHYWPLPNPMDGMAESVADAIHASLDRHRRANSTLTRPFDAAIFYAGTHYMPQSHFPTDPWYRYVSTDAMRFAAYRHDVHTIATAIARVLGGAAQPRGSLGQALPPRGIFFTQLRHCLFKAADRREQTVCAVARLNEAAAHIVHASGLSTLDSFALTRGAEQLACKDTVHHDIASMVPLMAIALEHLVGGEAEMRRAAARSDDEGEHAAHRAAAPLPNRTYAVTNHTCYEWPSRTRNKLRGWRRH